MVPSICVLSCMLTPGSTLGCQGGPDTGYSVRLSHALFLLCAESRHSESVGVTFKGRAWSCVNSRTKLTQARAVCS